MIKIRKFAELGKYKNAWLEANYHFNFSSYYDPNYTGFGKLLVLNDDKIAKSSGFSPHPHDNMEIITFVKTGSIAHKDSLGNEGITKAGNLQVMSAGTGIIHSEHSSDTEDTTVFQIWIKTREVNIQPRWDTRNFTDISSMQLVVSGNSKNSDTLYINQDVDIYYIKIQKDEKITIPVSEKSYLVMANGSLQNHQLEKGDGAFIENEESITINAKENSEIILITKL